jgi:hypothetical protein
VRETNQEVTPLPFLQLRLKCPRHTILRPGWFTREPEGPFQITQKGEPFQGHDISLDSLSTLIARIAKTPGLYVRSSIGVSDN